jgi:hypothetical protein
MDERHRPLAAIPIEQPADLAGRQLEDRRCGVNVQLAGQDVGQRQQAPLSPDVQGDCLPRRHRIEGDKVAVPLTGTESLSVHTAQLSGLTLVASAA